MKMFFDLLSESVIVQAAITLLIVSTVCYLIIVNRPVPEILLSLLFTIVGFYFGSKVQQNLNKIAKERRTDSDD